MTVELTTYSGSDALGLEDPVRALYETVFVEEPYREGPADFDRFAGLWPTRCEQPGFRLVLADDGGTPVGMAFGRPLPPDTTWWRGLLDDVPAALTEEWPGRSFGINEIAVLPAWRRQGLARRMHDQLLAGPPTDRALLLSRPEAAPAQTAYKAWGYERVGPLRPSVDAPVYDAMMLPLRPRA